MLDKVTLRGVSLPVLLFPSASIILPKLHSCSSHVALTRRANKRRLGDYQKAQLFQQLESIGQQYSLVLQVDTGYMDHCNDVW